MEMLFFFGYATIKPTDTVTETNPEILRPTDFFVYEEHEKAKIAQQIKDIYHERRKGVTDLELLSAYKKIRAPIKASKIAYGKSEDNTIKKINVYIL